MSEFIAYEKFDTISEVREFIELLKVNNIPYELEDNIEGFDVSFANNELNGGYGVKLLQWDFIRVNELRNQIDIPEVHEIGPDYYLFDFTDDELIELIAKQDEWSPFDFQLAQKILTDRGREIKAHEIAGFKEQRIQELTEPEKPNRALIATGYVLAFFGGIIGIGIGWHLRSNKRTLPNGERVHTFAKSDRDRGTAMIIIGVIMTVVWLTLGIFH